MTIKNISLQRTPIMYIMEFNFNNSEFKDSIVLFCFEIFISQNFLPKDLPLNIIIYIKDEDNKYYHTPTIISNYNDKEFLLQNLLSSIQPFIDDDKEYNEIGFKYLLNIEIKKDWFTWS